MKRASIIQKALLLAAWMLVGGGMITLLVAANRKEQGHVCRDMRISIKGDGAGFFIDKNDILLLLKKAANGSLINKKVEALNLSRLERVLERGVWIRDAELYFDSKNVLHVMVTEREPIARIFTRSGSSFYIDSSGKHMPLLEKETARVLVVSNYPAAKRYNAIDSAQAAAIKAIAKAISSSPFWKNQIAQVDITPQGIYEAIPVVGNHIIRLGNGEKIEEKLARLYTFYKQVAAKAGFDKYDIVDVQYEGQVVGVHKDAAATAVDSVQLAKNIEELLLRSRQQMLDDSVAQLQQYKALTDSASTTPLANVVLDSVKLSNPIPAKTANPNPTKSQASKPVSVKATPKAVMRRQR